MFPCTYTEHVLTGAWPASPAKHEIPTNVLKTEYMLLSLASYFGKIELENFFGTSFGDNELPEPHFNLRPGHSLAAVSDSKGAGGLALSEDRWGGENGDSGADMDGIVRIPDAEKHLSRHGITPCIVPVSGFYMWKNNDEKDQPFFVRMMNLPFMPVAAIRGGGSMQLLLTKSNTLVEPMSAVMPLVLNSSLVPDWLRKPEDLKEIAEKADKSFFITDFTVLKVSKKVSNPANNEPGLIQPLPK